MTAHHVFNENHFEFTASTNNEFFIHLESEFTALVFAGDEFENISTIVRHEFSRMEKSTQERVFMENTNANFYFNLFLK